MTKEQILDHFKDINHAYNECTRYDDLKRMLDELESDTIVLDKIRAEIIENSIEDYKYHGCGSDELIIETNEILKIIDKYKAEPDAKLLEKTMTLQTQAIVESYVKGEQ